MGNSTDEVTLETPSWIDKDLIQTAVRNGDGDNNLTVKSMTICRATAVGENYGSDMFRVSVQLQGVSEKRSLIIKTLPQGNREEMMSNSGVFPKETTVLTSIIPQMEQVLHKKAPGKFQSFSARCLHCGDKPNTFMILEDLSVPGFRNAPRQRGLDLAHCLLVVQSLARFHAASIAAHEQDQNIFKLYEKSIFNGEMQSIFNEFIKRSIQSLVTELQNWPDCHTRYASKLLHFSEIICNKLCKEIAYKPGKFNVLIHGDLWVNNMMFRYNKDDVVDLKFVDFQLSTFTSPAIDLQYFLHTSTNEDVRLNHFDQLIAEYHSTLTDTLSLIGCSQQGPSLEQLKMEFDDNYFYGLYAALTVLPIVVADPKSAHDIEKSIENILGGKESVEFEKTLHGNEYYIKAIQTFLPIFEQKGCFEF